MVLDQHVLWVFVEFKVGMDDSISDFCSYSEGISCTPDVHPYPRGKEVIVDTQGGSSPDTEENVYIPVSSA